VALVAANSDITVVIACHDYGRFLQEAVDSVLDQDGGPPQVVVVDDGSTDQDTLAVLDRLQGQPSVAVRRQDNRGVAVARNAGIALAATSYVLVMDADDRLALGALRLLRAVLEADGELGFAYGHMRFFGDWEGILRFPPYHPYRLLFRHIVGLSALARREVFEQTGGFDPDFGEYEDWELWVHALARGWQGRQVDAVTLEYRRHQGSKHGEDRRAYRRAYHRLHRKHASLYRSAALLAHPSSISTAERLLYRLVWGPRPLPASLERRVQARLWRPGAS
jgi:glycosyltransferase involved in cell wall biosynthesis